MKMYYKTILIFVALLAAISIKAQNLPITFGVKGGFNLSDIDGDIKHTDSKFGFLIGASAEYAINANWVLMSGLELTSKGADIDGRGYDGKINAVYLQIPAHIGYKFNIANKLIIVPHAGSYLAYGITGKSKLGSHKENTFGNTMDRLDIGLGTGAGIELNQFFFDLNFDFGIIDVGRNGVDVSNQTIYLTTTYKF